MQEGYKVCPFCAEEIKGIAKKCRYCGESVKVNEPILSLDQKAIIGVLIFALCLFFIQYYYQKLTSCETLYDNLVSKNPDIAFVENNIKRNRGNGCIAYISILGKFNNINQVDFNLKNGYSINTIGNNNWKDYYGFLVIDLDNESLITGTLVRLPNEKEFDSINSATFFNNADIARTSAINYFNKLYDNL